MSIGLPVIASKVTGNKDTIVHENSGFFYQLGGIESASKYIHMLAKDTILRRRLGKEGLNQQRKFFSSEKMIATYARIYSTF